MIPKFRAWYTPFKGETIGQEMKYGQAGRLITMLKWLQINMCLCNPQD